MGLKTFDRAIGTNVESVCWNNMGPVGTNMGPTWTNIEPLRTNMEPLYGHC